MLVRYEANWKADKIVFSSYSIGERERERVGVKGGGGERERAGGERVWNRVRVKRAGGRDRER